MNQGFKARHLFFLILISISLFSQKTTAKPPIKIMNYYELVDIDQQKLNADFIRFLRADDVYQKADKAWNDADKALNEATDANKKAAADKRTKIAAAREKVYHTLKNKFYTEKIKAACKKALAKYEKEQKKAEKAYEKAGDLARQQKYEKFIEIVAKNRRARIGCPVLLNPKKRDAYDKQLIQLVARDATYFNAVHSGIEQAKMFAPDKKVILNAIIGDLLSKIEIPEIARTVFNQDLALRDLGFLPLPMGSDVQYGIGFTGLMALNKFEVRLSVYVIQDIYGTFKYSFIVDLPTGYKISDFFPSFTAMDAFTFPSAQFIIASFEGSDQEGRYFKKGFNFNASLDLSGPLAILNDLKEKSSKLKSLVFESKPIKLNGLIPPNVAKTRFSAKLPLYIGVDLRQIGVIPKALSNVINKITSDDFELTISPVESKPKEKKEIGLQLPDKIGKQIVPYQKERGQIEVVKGLTPIKWDDPEVVLIKSLQFPYPKLVKMLVTLGEKKEALKAFLSGFQVQAEGGLRITLGTQPNPILLHVLGIVIPIGKKYPGGLLTIGGKIKGMLQLKWLALGNVALMFDFDGALMPEAAAVGMPFTGIGIQGQLDLGKKGDARATLNVAGGYRISTEIIPDLVFDVTGSNIQFAHIVSYATRLFAKTKLIAPLEVERIPTMTLHKIWGYCALGDSVIGGKTYKGGLGLQVETEFFNKKAGFKIAMDNKFKLSGWGYMPPIEFKVKGQKMFQLYGEKEDKGPLVSFDFDPKKPLKGHFTLKSTVKILPLALEQRALFDWNGYRLSADFESKVAEFSVLFGIRMNTKEGVELLPFSRDVAMRIETLLQEGEKQPAFQMLTMTQYNSIKDQVGIVWELLDRLKEHKEYKQYDEAQALYNLAIDEYTSLPRRKEILEKNLKALLPKQIAKRQGVPQRVETPIVRPEVIGTPSDETAIIAKMVARQLPKKIEETIEKFIMHPLNTAEESLRQLARIRGKYSSVKMKEVETDPMKKWRKFYVNFGFRGDFAAFLNKHAVEPLYKVKENAAKKLDQLGEKIAMLQAQTVQGVTNEIERVKEAIATKEREISDLEAACHTLPLHKLAQCRARIIGQKAIVAKKKVYLNALLKPGRAITKGVLNIPKQLAKSKVLQKATEAIFGGAAIGLEMIAKGINLFNITEAIGEYSWDDMKQLKLPRLVRLVAKIMLPGLPLQIVLSDLQFDFRNPVHSTKSITHALLVSFIESQHNKYVGYAIKLAQ